MVQLKDVMNTMKDNFQRTRVSEEVRTEGTLGRQALVLDVEGKWRELTGVVNKLAAKHLKVRSIAKISRILSREWCLDYERWWWKSLESLRALAAEVTPVTLEVGSQGKLGGQAHVPDVEGVWLNLVRNVAFINVDVQEEMLDLKTTVNSMAAQLGTLANEVTQGTWKVLTDNGQPHGHEFDQSNNVRGEILQWKETRRRDGRRLGSQARTTNIGGTWKGLMDSDGSQRMFFFLTLQGRTIAVLVYPRCTAGGTRSEFDS
ncbi:hypothetical protein BYT27DRAFT_7336636 [Phlegmacium glaucopus]|nr:hypothetical protein BYT27DRAFT_7336636 [Phlegmacium glaucopus]